MAANSRFDTFRLKGRKVPFRLLIITFITGEAVAFEVQIDREGNLVARIRRATKFTLENYRAILKIPLISFELPLPKI